MRAFFKLQSRATRSRRRPGVIILLLAACLITSCSTRRTSPAGGQTVTDELGRTVNAPARPQRIVSLAPSITEILFALGLGDRVVGVTSYCDYPPEATGKEKVGDTVRPSVEKLVALRADLVIASTSSQLEQFIAKLDDLSIPVYISNPRRVGDVTDTIERIGTLTGATERARELSDSLQKRMAAIDAGLAGAERLRVLVILNAEPLITAGGSTFVNDLIERAGGRSISANESAEYPQYSLETAVAARPEVIFLQAQDAPLPGRLKETPAARAGRVYHIDDNLMLRPGPRIVDGLEQMAAELHPEIFKPGNH
ncbi:MAG TPA: helical backbone metal receptor [Blastocatellia bacterium]|nr:helical backbone metal receptor [Blastocatellia bacterium]